jgi:hypothetical protein
MMFCLRFWQSQVLALQEAIARLMFVIPKGGSQGGISYAHHRQVVRRALLLDQSISLPGGTTFDIKTDGLVRTTSETFKNKLGKVSAGAGSRT